MPRPKSPPKYQLHKTKGSAITRIDGRIIYLGKYGSRPVIKNLPKSSAIGN